MSPNQTAGPGGGQETAPPATSASQDEEECMICLNTLERRATIIPCGHTFDYACIKRWITGGERAARLCPCCRGYMTQLGTKFRNHSSYTFEPIIDKLFPQIEWSPDGFEAAGAARGEGGGEGRSYADGYDRLRGQPLIILDFPAVKNFEKLVRFKGRFWLVQSTVGLQIVQSDQRTTSLVLVRYDIQEILDPASRTAFKHVEIQEDEASIRQYQKARAFIDGYLSIPDRELRETDRLSTIDDRGLYQELSGRAHVHRGSAPPSRFSLGPEGDFAQVESLLVENGPAYADTPLITRRLRVLEKKDEKILEMVEAISSILHELNKLQPEIVGGHLLDRAYTGILEMPKGPRLCEQCGITHWNGSCRPTPDPSQNV